MTFYAIKGKRPIRLSNETRKFAYESLNHKYGKETQKNRSVFLDECEDFENLTELQKYNLAIEKITKNSPIRICEGEMVSGAATLGMSINHNIPVTFKGRSVFSSSVSHLTIDFETVLKKGVNYIKEQAISSLKIHNNTNRKDFIISCIHCINCFEIWRDRYLEVLKNMPNYSNNYNNHKKVPFEPATNFYEAVQSLWFTFAFVRLCGNWPGIGRIDWLLGDYLKKDLADGTLTLEEAREILAHFFIKGCEWITGNMCISGDAQHYQNIILCGVDENGQEVTNEVTYLVLDILEELGISDFPTTVRINSKSDEKLLQRVAEVISYGGGIIAVYNEDLILDSLVNYGYKLEEARKFANDGCWEVQIPGKTFFNYIPFDALQILQRETLKNYDNSSFDDFDTLYNKFILDMKSEVEKIVLERSKETFISTDSFPKDWKWKSARPCTVVSLFEKGCIQSGLSYLEGGPIYNVISPHIGGLPDVVNSLYAIKKLVFDDKKVSFNKFLDILKNNWDNQENLRKYLLNKYTYFGNDNDEVDMLAKRIIDDFADICDEINKKNRFEICSGVSTFGRQIEWSTKRLATPFGKKSNEVLSGNFSPTPGTDKEGATAIIKSYCKANLKKTVSGAALDVKLLPTVVEGEKGQNAVVSLLKTFVSLGGHFMQIDITDKSIYLEAQKHPEDYRNLSVRVSGWNARFVTLSEEWQNMIIEQSEGKM